jgi:DNA-binding SARP family transcriptional activator
MGNFWGEAVRYRILGPVEVYLGGQWVNVARPRRRAVLSYLLLQAGQTVSPDRLSEAIWAGAAPATARAQLQADISAIRRALREDQPDQDGDEAVSTRPGGYRIDLTPGELDLAEFTELTAQGRQGELAQRSATLREALAIWRGPALTGVVAAFVDGTRSRLEEQRLGAYERLAEVELALGHHQDLAEELAEVVDSAPLHERLHGQLMLALHRSGRSSQALAVARDLRRRLADEQGLDVGRPLATLEQQILRADPALEPAATGRRAAPGVTVRTDLTGPRWVVPRQLPPDISDFTGRTGELTTLRSRLAGRPGTALVVAAIAGMGGIGKTALALHLAHQVAGDYPDGQLYVNLRGAEAIGLNSGDVLGRFLRAIGVDSRSIPDDPDERAELYRSHLADRKLLVVLDNAGSEEQVRPLLPGSAGSTVLITSRLRLTGVEGARWVDLDVFEAEPAVALLARITDPERVSAQRADADVIVRLCGGLPLAVRIAGARLDARPNWRLADLARMLGDETQRLDGLTAGDLEVRASLALSYQGLGEPARRLFRRLGLLDTPDFPAWLADVVLHQPAATHLEALVDAQLLSIGGTDPAGQDRYRFHDLVRLYARERTESEDSAEVRTAVLRHGLGAWLAVAEQLTDRVPGPCFAVIHGPALRPPIGDLARIVAVDPLVWFDAERVALISAVHQACALGLDDLAFDLAGCLEKYFDLRGMYVDWGDTNRRALAVCRAAGNRRGEAVMLRGLVEVVTWNTDHIDDAMGRLQEDAAQLVTMFTELADDRGRADAIVLQSWAFSAKGFPVQAIEAAERSRQLAESSGHLGGQARALVAQAVAHGALMQLEPALAALHKALTLTRTLGNPRYEAAVLQFLGIAHLQAGDFNTSRARLEESMAISRTYHDDYTGVLTMIVQARLQLTIGDPQARDTAERSLALGRLYTMNHHVADALGVLGEIELAEGNPARAVACLSESVRIWRTRGWLAFLASGLQTLGDACAAIDPPGAVAAWSEARDLFARLGHDALVTDLDRRVKLLVSARIEDA